MYRINLKYGFTVVVLVVVIHNISQISCASEEENEVDQTAAFIPKSLRHILTDDVPNYQIPMDIQKNFVYYLSGFDDENRPVWVVEVGKWDLRSKIEGGDQAYEDFDHFILLAIYRMLNSTLIMSTEDAPVDQAVLLVDMEDFSLKQISSIPTMRYILGRVRTFRAAFTKMHAGYLINTNYVAQSLLNTLRPILGKDFDKLEVYGNSKTKWMPRILKNIPRDQLPEWYGGVKDFTPFQVYG